MQNRKALLFGRPFTKSFDELYGQIGVNYGVDYVGISDFKAKLGEQLRPGGRQYKLLESSSFDTCEFETDNVIARCRYLRAINLSLAENLVSSYSQAIDELFDSMKIDHVISVPVDNYASHLLYLHCQKRGLYFLLLSGHSLVRTQGLRLWVSILKCVTLVMTKSRR